MATSSGPILALELSIRGVDAGYGAVIGLAQQGCYQVVLGPEVVQQHSIAGTERRGEWPKAESYQPSLQHIVGRRAGPLFPTLEILGHHENVARATLDV